MPTYCFPVVNPESISMLKDVVLMLSGVAGATIAFQGLTTWRRQLAGANDYELARRALMSLYLLRDAVKRCRDPYISPVEYPQLPSGEGAGLRWSEILARGEIGAYAARWNGIEAARTALDGVLLEAEVLWSSDFRIGIKDADACLRKLKTALRDHQRALHEWSQSDNDRKGQPSPSAVLKEPDEGKDAFGDEFLAALKPAEKLLKRHLPSSRAEQQTQQ